MYVDPTGHSFFDDFITGLVGAVAFAGSAVAIVGTGGALAPVAAALAEGTAAELAAAGAIGGAVSGGLGAGLNRGNVFMGAGLGAITGAMAGGFAGGFEGAAARQLAGGVLASGAAGAAYATGGLKGLAHFGAGFAGAMVGGYGLDWYLDPPGDYPTMAAEIRANASSDQRTMGDTIYGEAGGGYPGNYDDKLGVGWSMRNRYEAGQGSYEEIASKYAPRSTLKPNVKTGAIDYLEFKDFQVSYKAAGEVLNASPASNPIPGVTHFHDLRITTPSSWGAAQTVTYGTGRLIFYKNIP